MPDALADVPLPAGPPEDQGREVALLALVAAGVLSSFTGLADDAASAPDVVTRVALTRMAGALPAHLDPIERAAVARSADLGQQAAPFLALLADVDARTAGGDWWERVVKTYVAGGMVIDLHRALSEGVDEDVRAVVTGALVENGHAAWVVATLGPVLAAEPQLAARLALWGRRVAGEALSLAQTVVRTRPDLVAGPPDAAVAGLLSAMTGGHARRMGRLGLTA
ncbi:ferritin-like fold-containing protein [Georgenia faecalis]|uniref:Ferritin-like fold-containing protein n=1 Tax=Georgenia faecalis TaxID=2483799 RepID=A0ABV9D686_9MICO|nr:ferritin-like fold-containing protein [Georgenia faecalis]